MVDGDQPVTVVSIDLCLCFVLDVVNGVKISFLFISILLIAFFSSIVCLV